MEERYPGQTPDAFWISINHAENLIAVGLNCALGGKQLRPHLEELSKVAHLPVSAYPNAGLPNEFGEYDESAEEFAHQIEDFAKSGFVNLVGGCCGTTPEHIAAVREVIDSYPPRKPQEKDWGFDSVGLNLSPLMHSVTS